MSQNVKMMHIRFFVELKSQNWLEILYSFFWVIPRRVNFICRPKRKNTIFEAR